jgi:hypothetical protein
MRNILKIAPLAFFIAISFNTAVFAGYNIKIRYINETTEQNNSISQSLPDKGNLVWRG